MQNLVTIQGLMTPAGAADLGLDLGAFADTSAQITARTDAGRAFLAQFFGAGAVLVALRKSEAMRLVDVATANGLTVA